MTPDELEAAGYPRDYHDLPFEERQRISSEHAKETLRQMGATAGSQPEQLAHYEDTSGYGQDVDRFLKNAKLAVVGSYNSTHEMPDQLEPEQLYIVWFAKVLKNWKALISTNVPGDGLYFEVTYNGEPGNEESYVDTYRKEDNQVFSHHDH